MVRGRTGRDGRRGEGRGYEKEDADEEDEEEMEGEDRFGSESSTWRGNECNIWFGTCTRLRPHREEEEEEEEKFIRK